MAPAPPSLEEHWAVDLATGALTGKAIVDHTAGQPAADGRLSLLQPDIRLAITPSK